MLYKLSYILNKYPFNVNTWTEATNAVKKVPADFQTTTLQHYDDVNNYNTQIAALQTAADKIPSTFNNTTLKTLHENFYAIAQKIIDMSWLPTPSEPLTWTKLVNSVKMILELQQTVSNIISQLNAQSLIDLGTLQTALDEGDRSLQTIADRLKEMQ
jgi:hypothetical protein